MAELLGPDDLDVAVEALRCGRLVAFPTETVYGLGADVSSGPAVDGIFLAKGRPAGHPLIAHVASVDGLLRVGRDVNAKALALAEALWPGPLTLIVGRGETVALEATGGRETVGVRMPDHRLALAMLDAFGGGVAGPSANRFGAVSPTTAQHVLDDLGDRIDFVVDGGPCRVGLESTIVDMSGDRPLLLRPGGVPISAMEAVLGESVSDDRTGPARASGMLASHYAPEVTVELATSDELIGAIASASRTGHRVGVIAPLGLEDLTQSQPMKWLWELPADSEGYGEALYRTLRLADAQDLDLLLIVAPQSGATVDAVLDRLGKAAAPRNRS